MHHPHAIRARIRSNLLALPLALVVGCSSLDLRRPNIEQTEHTIAAVAPNGQTLFQYFLQPPVNSPLSVASGGFFHPLTTPAGRVVTDLAPADHLHHRGLFLALVEVHGTQDADFWGWGEPAPAQDRQIRNEEIHVSVNSQGRIEFEAHNRWTAKGEVLIHEKLRASLETLDTVHRLDLIYELTPQSDLTVGQWAFGGFCLRFPKGGTLDIAGPTGRSIHGDPNHLVPATDWPDEPYYAAWITMDDGTQFGAALMNHPDNPPTLWHNHRTTRILNPCITAPGELHWRRGETVRLKYRVVTFDNAPPLSLLNSLATSWAKEITASTP